MIYELSPRERIRALAELELRDRTEQEIKNRWSPLPGPQTQAFYSKADVLFYGGSAGSGKTDLLISLALSQHHRSILFRREYPQLKGIIDRSIDLFDGLGRYNSSTKIWRLDNGGSLEFGAVEHEKDKRKYQGRAHDLKCFDEITHFSESQFRYLITWLRSADSNQRKRVVCAGNPPTSIDGTWVKKYWGAWVDKKRSDKAKSGELRWYTSLKGEDVEVESGAPFEYEGKLIYPQSRTFIAGTIKDNPYLLDSGYLSTLQALKEPLRSIYLEGNFDAAAEDDEWQLIPTDWILLAQQRWRERPRPDTPMTSLGVDVARGGKDNTVLSPKHGNWFDKQILHPGTSTPDGELVANLAVKTVRDGAVINIDVIGVGASAYDFLSKAYGNTVPLNSSCASDETDKTEQLSFKNGRAEWWWKFMEALDPKSGEDYAIPDDDELTEELCGVRWKMSGGKIQIEDKQKLKERIGRSPDKGDSLVYASAIKEYNEPRITIF